MGILPVVGVETLHGFCNIRAMWLAHEENAGNTGESAPGSDGTV
jgi:hypothetical protein